MRSPLLIALAMLVSIVSCKNKPAADRTTYHKTYEIGKVPGIDSFYILNEVEKQADSQSRKYPDVPGINDFKNNRSRLYLDSGYDEATNEVKKFPSAEPMPCGCAIRSDSLLIGTGIGFFGGRFYEIGLSKNEFESGFYIYTDDTKPFKSSLSDSFSSEAKVKSKYQYLILSEKPTFKPGQQVTGLLTFTMHPLYEDQQNGRLDTTVVSGKLYFTCKTKEYKERRWDLPQ